MTERWRSTPPRAIGWDIAILGGYWFLAFALIRVAYLLPASVSRQIGEVVAGAIGVSVAFFLHARIASFLLAAFFAFSTAEFSMDMIFGFHSVPGRGAHFAVLVAAFIAVTLVTFTMRLQTQRTASQ